jgi:hypothetical protein
MGYSFMIELKHAYVAYAKAHNSRASAIKGFSEALRQLGNIRTAECRNLKFGKGLRKIALEAVVFYRGLKQKNALEADARSKNFRTLHKELLRAPELNTKSNLHALWVLNKRLVSPIEYSNTWEIYPAVAFIGAISDLVE